MYTISFQSTHNAIKSKAIFTKEKITLNVIPTPRVISSSCGMSIQVIDDTPVARLKELIADNEIAIYGIFDENLNKVED
ncbi:MAG: DUF3343 domain-containing protein [Filifactoraceae bacterium]